MIYLDHNATRPLRKNCYPIIHNMLHHVGNPSSVHVFGRAVRKIIEDAREYIAHLLEVQPKRIIFTSGATESNNLAIKNYKRPVVISTVEHDSLHLVRDDVHFCPVNESGILDLKALESLLSRLGPKTLVSINTAHNETGIIQPVEEISEIIKRHHGIFHTDAVQAIGRLPFDAKLFDMVSLSSHKIGGLSGVGVLIVNPDIRLLPIMLGGGQERSYRPGTENLMGLAVLPIALEEALREDWSVIQHQRVHLEKQLLQVSPGSIVIGKNVDRLPNTTLITMSGVKSETQVMCFDQKRIAVSAGSACSSGKVKISRTLKSMGCDDGIAGSAVRISQGPDTTLQDIEQFINSWRSIYERLSLRSAS